MLILQMETRMNFAPPSAPFPVQHRSLTLDIKGNKTDIVISKYEDSFLVIVTQIGCMGTILAAKKDESVFSDPTYNVSVLFGKRDEPLLLACARQLIEHIRFACSPFTCAMCFPHIFEQLHKISACFSCNQKLNFVLIVWIRKFIYPRFHLVLYVICTNKLLLF
ncbi:hypothetical protein ABZP36_029818 [Zizania latifolia]